MKEEIIFKPKKEADNYGIKFKIDKLVNLEQQNIARWARKYRTIMKQCSFTEEEAVDYLQFVVEDDLIYLIEGKRTLETCLESLIKQVYNRDTFVNIQRKLEKIKVSQFDDVASYYEKCQELFKEARLCVGSEEMFLEREMETYLIKGLAAWMKLEMIKFEDLPLYERIKKLIKLEIQIKENAERKNEKTRNSYINKFEKGKKGSVWCKLHRTTSHSNEECFTQGTLNKKKEIEDKSYKRKESYSVIREKNPAPDNILLKRKRSHISY